jgi:hypothetical protein
MINPFVPFFAVMQHEERAHVGRWIFDHLTLTIKIPQNYAVNRHTGFYTAHNGKSSTKNLHRVGSEIIRPRHKYIYCSTKYLFDIAMVALIMGQRS